MIMCVANTTNLIKQHHGWRVITACIVIIECDWYISTGKCVYFVVPNLFENTFLTTLKHENDNTISKSLLLLMIIHDNCLLSLIKTHNYNNHLKSSSMLRLHNTFVVTGYGGPGQVSVSPVITRCHIANPFTDTTMFSTKWPNIDIFLTIFLDDNFKWTS